MPQPKPVFISLLAGVLLFALAVPSPALAKIVTVKTAKGRNVGVPICAAKYPAAGKYGAASLHVRSKTCWACPKGHRRTLKKISGPKGCRKGVAGKHARAVKRGAPGCAKGTSIGAVLPVCYRCPPRYKYVPLLPKSAKAKGRCVQVLVDRNAIKKPKFIKWARAEVKKLRTRYAPQVKQAMILAKRLLKHKRALATRAIAAHLPLIKRAASGVKLSTPASRKNKSGSGFRSVSIGVAVDMSLIVGVAATPYSRAYNIDGWDDPVEYFGASFSAGVTAGIDLSVEVGLWMDPKKKLSGGLHGLVVGLTVQGGFAVTFWFKYAKDTKSGAPEFAGLTVIPEFGVSAELEYTCGRTVPFQTYINKGMDSPCL